MAWIAWMAGCAAPVGSDAASDASDASDASGDTRLPDSATDAAVVRPLFADCSSNAECGARARCLLEYPGGLCSRSCSSDSQCAGGICIDSICLPTCSLGGGECSASRVCVVESSTRTDRRACLPACSTPTVPGEPSCGSGRQCNAYASFGTCTAFSHDPERGDNGAPCREDADCRGACIQEEYDGQPTGYTDGYCESLGRVPSASLYGPRIPLPRSNCPEGSVLIPAESGAAEGDWGECLKECRADSDCRRNMRCLFFEFRGGGRSSTGYCSAINCLYARFVAEPNNGCAPGFRCQRLDEPQPVGACVRDADAGVDGGASDAALLDAFDDVETDVVRSEADLPDREARDAALDGAP